MITRQATLVELHAHITVTPRDVRDAWLLAPAAMHDRQVMPALFDQARHRVGIGDGAVHNPTQAPVLAMRNVVVDAPHRIVIVAVIQVHVLHRRRWLVPANHQLAQRGFDQLPIVAGCASNGHAQRNAIPVGEQALLGPRRAAVRRVRSSHIPPKRSFDHRTVHGVPLER
jgi:hypothetical protein